MNVLIAPDKFKGCLSAAEVARAIARGVRNAAPDAVIDCIALADGGEGIVDALVESSAGTLHTANVSGPLGQSVEATYGLLGDGTTAVLEMAAASGLVLVPHDLRDPLRATTRGTGELLLHAVRGGARRVILGIGGSATNDGGAGLAQALGFRLLDVRGAELGPGGGPLSDLDRIVPPDHPPLGDAEILVACDVTNPLCGPQGASAIYGPQKGATPAMVAQLDASLEHFAAIIRRDLGVDIRDLPGAGAAGGLGAGLVAFAGGSLSPGIEIVLKTLGVSAKMERADLCLTGEGSVDHSSAYGKTVAGVGALAASLGVPAIALAGTIGPGYERLHERGIVAIFPIAPGPITLQESLARAPELLEAAAESLMRLVVGFASGPKSHLEIRNRNQEDL
ncbi:glycerate kinase [Isosphaeraceae bacterium EP7]